MQKYIDLAKELGMADAMLISPNEIVFDIRALLKCRWGCTLAANNGRQSVRCNTGGVSLSERQDMVKAYKNILLLHCNDKMSLSRALLDVERAAFYDGYYLAFALKGCNLCKDCGAAKGEQCPTPKLARPCEEVFGVDVFATARGLGFPIEVVQKKGDLENRYGFVLIN